MMNLLISLFAFLKVDAGDLKFKPISLKIPEESAIIKAEDTILD